MLNFAGTRYRIPARRKCISEFRLGVSAIIQRLLRLLVLSTTVTDFSTEDTQTTAFDALRKGLEDMIEACDVVTDKFTTARDEFVSRKR